MNILLITARSDIGGGPKYTADFARALKPEHEVFIASPLDAPYGPELKSIARSHFELPHRSFGLLTFFRLLSFARTHQINRVHSHGRGAGIYARLLKFFGFQVVHTFHGIHKDPSVPGRMKFYLDRVLNPFTDAFVFVSESERAEANAQGFQSSKPFHIVHPLAPPVWLEAPRLFHSPIRLGSISRLDHMKGIDLLFKNLGQFHALHPELKWTFDLAGAGQFQFEIPESIRSRVKLHGAIRDPIPFLRGLDIYLANSRWEAFNITVVEALSQGLPALISTVPGHDYFIQAGVAIGFDPKNGHEFSTKLSTLMMQPKPNPQFDWVKIHHSRMPTSQIYNF